ncbi:MAG: FGGY family carbohydrate kinase, partial [Verrucomicrobiota bacterium]
MNEDRCLIGIDAGTSLVKAVAFDYAGDDVGSHEMPLPLRRPQPLWIEQDMDRLWKTAQTCLRKVAAELRRKKRALAGVGITSTGDGTFLMTREGRAIRGGLLWCDGRAGKIVERWHADGTAAAAFEICGTSVFTGSQAAQLAWLRENEPEALRRANVIFHAKDWLFYKLTGVVSSDETDESLTMLRMSTRRYDPELFKIFGIEDLFSKYPEVRPTEANVAPVLPAIAKETGLPAGTPIGSGPMDVAACALGSGAVEDGQASSILGTA